MGADAENGIKAIYRQLIDAGFGQGLVTDAGVEGEQSGTQVTSVSVTLVSGTTLTFDSEAGQVTVQEASVPKEIAVELTRDGLNWCLPTEAQRPGQDDDEPVDVEEAVKRLLRIAGP